MIREIKFRGKRIDNQEWVYGFYRKNTFYNRLVDEPKEIYTKHFIGCFDNITYFGGMFEQVEVYPDSVGQYIGIKGYAEEYKNRHKNEVDLYEGDIVEAMSEGSKGRFLITYRTESSPMWLLYPNYQDRKHWNIHGSDLGREKGDYFDTLKVIGNIHENPELLTA